MSFILDALRKSEHERQRQTGPGLAEVAVAPPRTRTNVWATAAIALLVVNLVAIGVLLLRKARDEPTAGPAPAAEQAAPPTVAAPAISTPPPATAAAPAPQASITQTVSEPPPMLRPAEPGPVAPATRNPLEDQVSDYAPPIDPRMQAAAAAPPEGPPAVTRRPSTGGSVVYESLPEAYPNGSSQYAAQTGASAGLPTADEFAARVGLPELKLELHVYSNRPQERVAFINSHKYREGDTLAEGPQVEQITPDGVVLSLRGSKFLLPRE
jgi:general secretion pathway protein B